MATAAWASNEAEHRTFIEEGRSRGRPSFWRFAGSFARKNQSALDSIELSCSRIEPDPAFPKEVHMRALFLLATIFVATFAGTAHGQMKLSTKTAPGASEIRYFTTIDGLMDGDADAILKETRQGKIVTAAVLDVCYPMAKGSDRKDRFVVNLAVNG